MALRRLPSKNKQSFLLVILLLAVVALMFGMAKCSRPIGGHGDDSEIIAGSVKKSGGDTLDVAIELSPLSYSMSGDTITGLDYELLSLMSSRNNRPVKFHPFVPLRYALDGLSDGLFDIVISALPATDSLKNNFLLTDPVFLDREVLVQLRDAPTFIPTPEELTGDSVWIAAGSPFKERIINLAQESGDTIHVVESEKWSAEQLVILVARGKIPRAVVNERIASKMKAMKYDSLDYSVPVSFTQFQTWAIAKDNDVLRDTINAWLKDVRDTPEYNAILTQYGATR